MVSGDIDDSLLPGLLDSGRCVMMSFQTTLPRSRVGSEKMGGMLEDPMWFFFLFPLLISFSHCALTACMDILFPTTHYVLSRLPPYILGDECTVLLVYST
jgi:hypothetical protein